MVRTVAVTVDPGAAVTWEEIQKMGVIYQKLSTDRRVMGLCLCKLACILVFLFSPLVRLSLVKMQKFYFISFLLLSFAVLYPAKRMIQPQVST